MKLGPLNLKELDKAYVCVVQLSTQPQGVIHQVVLRPDKVKKIHRVCQYGHAHESGLIVLGETEGDQIFGWQYPENVRVIAVLGEAVEKDGKFLCQPLEKAA